MNTPRPSMWVQNKNRRRRVEKLVTKLQRDMRVKQGGPAKETHARVAATLRKPAP